MKRQFPKEWVDIVSERYFKYIAENRPVNYNYFRSPGAYELRYERDGFTEKEIALKIALNLGELLEKDISNQVIYTRKSDVFLKLRERAKIANSADADLFISIHCNSFHDPKVFGTETYVLGLHANERNFNIAKQENEVIFLEEKACRTSSENLFEAPITLVGLTALSVLTNSMFSTLFSIAALATL